jgi:hypothetical protein
MPDPYEIIGVRRDASLDEIRIAYRRSAQVLHPDRFATSSDGVRSEAARRMLQLNGAMEAIESERADEASGTGGLGSVGFGGAPPAAAPATKTAPPPAPTRPMQELGPDPADEANGATPPTTPPTPARISLPGTVPPPPTEAPPSTVPARIPTPVASAPPTVEPAPPPAADPTPAPAAGPAPRPSFEPAPTLRDRIGADSSVETPDPIVQEPPPQRRTAGPGRVPGPEPYALDTDDGYDDYDDDLPPVRRARSRPGERSILPLVIVGVVALIAVAVIAGYFVLGRGGSGDATFAKANAPFTFRYPHDFAPRRLDGGVALNKPTFQVGFGLDASNYMLASTYKLGFDVQADGSATGPKGQQLTPNQIDHDIDVTIAKLATQAGLKQQGVESGSLGALRARIYDYAKPDGSITSKFVVALSGKTEYYVTCQSSPRGATRVTKACDRLLATFAPA